jgi:hypothetical protein
MDSRPSFAASKSAVADFDIMSAEVGQARLRWPLLSPLKRSTNSFKPLPSRATAKASGLGRT